MSGMINITTKIFLPLMLLAVMGVLAFGLLTKDYFSAIKVICVLMLAGVTVVGIAVVQDCFPDKKIKKSAKKK